MREENGGDGTTTMRYMHLSSASLNQAIRLLEQRDPVGGNSGATRGGPSLAAPGIMALHGKGPAALTGVERLGFGSPALGEGSCRRRVAKRNHGIRTGTGLVTSGQIDDA